MGKNRQVLIISIVLAALVVGLVLCCVLLRAKTFEVQVQSSPSFRVSEDLSAATDRYRGKSVLFLSAGDLRRDVERAYPYVRVKDVEKNVSSKVILRVVERYELFALYDGERWTVLDSDLKVLRVTETEPETFDGVDKLVKVKLPARGAVERAEPGETVVFARTECRDFLEAFSAALAERGRSPFAARQEFGTIDLSTANPGGTGDGSIVVSGSFGCTFTLLSVYRSGGSARPFVNKLMELFYADDFDRETGAATLRLEDGAVNTEQDS